MSGTDIHLSIHDRISSLSAKEWDALHDGHPFLRHAFLDALEQSGSVHAESGWHPNHLAIHKSDGQLLGAMPAYLKGHSYGEYVFDQHWADALQRAGGRYYPKLQSAIPFTPVTGQRLLVAKGADQDLIRRQLLEGGRSFVRDHGLSGFHLNFLTEEEARFADNIDFLIRTDQQFHWQNKGYGSFDDFLASLSSRKRKQINKERRQAQESGIIITAVEGPDITEADWDSFFSFYLDTSNRKWGRPYLNREFFSLIGQTMPDGIVLFMCHMDGKAVAGALNFKDKDTLYGRYWGAVEHHPFLHFETCYYRAIDYGIAHGLSKVEAGAQGPHKIARGYIPVKTTSVHWLADDGFHHAVRRYLQSEREDVDEAIKMLSRHSPYRKG